MGSGTHIITYAVDFMESLSGKEIYYSPSFTVEVKIA
jgi:hypothetical protein